MNGPGRGVLLLWALLAEVGPAWTAPKDPWNYEVVRGGMADIPPGSHVEGSLRAGGTQPDYVVDLDSPEFQPLLRFARGQRDSRASYWEKIRLLLDYIRGQVLVGRDYHEPRYVELVARYRGLEQDVPLSRYIGVSAGVCREYALITHLALKAAGIPNRHVYALIHHAKNGSYLLEDHGFTVVRHDGEEWVVDAYFDSFNGYRLSDLRGPDGIGPNSPYAPIARQVPDFRRIVQINDYPTVWIPSARPRAAGTLSRPGL
ncbi:MAG: hypothetical protein HY554_14320 [Elusimicrobia bacterium]|nr:hypothetical protein [Elusimicrobiota bacterium]